jgi:hypothetical protein
MRHCTLRPASLAGVAAVTAKAAPAAVADWRKFFPCRGSLGSISGGEILFFIARTAFLLGLFFFWGATLFLVPGLVACWAAGDSESPVAAAAAPRPPRLGAGSSRRLAGRPSLRGALRSSFLLGSTGSPGLFKRQS